MIDKELLVKDNKSPAHYSLSEAGWALADKLARASQGEIPVHKPLPLAPAFQPQPSTGAFRPAVSQRDGPLFLPSDDDDDMEVGHLTGLAPSHSARQSAAAAAIRRLTDRTPVSSLAQQHQGAHPSSDTLLHRSRSVYDGTAVHSRPSPSTHTPAGADGPFEYSYLDERDQRVGLRSQAEVGQDETDGFAAMYRIEYRAGQDLHPVARGLRGKATFKEGREGTRQAFMRERQAAMACPGLKVVSPSKPVVEEAGGAGANLAALMAMGGHKDKGKRADPRAMCDGLAGEVVIRGMDESSPVQAGAGKGTGWTANATSDQRDNGLPPRLALPQASDATDLGRASRAAPLRGSASMPAAFPASTSRPVVPQPLLPTSSGHHKEPMIASFDSFDAAAPPGTAPLLVNRHPLDPVADHIPPPGFTPPTFTPITWPAGSYTICLVIDMREQAGLRSNKNEIVGALKALDRSMEVEQRMLPVGDMVWVAKKKASWGGRAGVDECVLDCVVERKRLDDLCGSIRDGRYLTQKVSRTTRSAHDDNRLIWHLALHPRLGSRILPLPTAST